MEKILSYKNYNSKKGLSAIITTLLLVMLTLVAVGIFWGVIMPMIKEKTESSKACFGNYGKVTINSLYTCYDSTLNQVHFSLNIGDIDVDEVLVSVSSAGATKAYTLTNTEQQITGLANYSSTGFGTDLIVLPGKNAGKTYISNEFAEKPDLIQIAPVINEQQCEVSDTLSGIEFCF